MAPTLNNSSGSSHKIPEHISVRLGSYARTASAAGVSLLAMAYASRAEVVYTAAHKVLGSNDTIAIDFNHDGIADFVIRESSWIDSFGFPVEELRAVPMHGGGIVMGSFIGSAAALPAGAAIGPRRTFYHKPALMIGYSAAFYGTYFGLWAHGVTDRYLGVQFVIGGQVHYGWARVKADLKFPEIVAVLKGFAYETEPNRPIRAGDNGLTSQKEPALADEGLPPASLRQKPAASLGLLALGALGLPVWRPE